LDGISVTVGSCDKEGNWDGKEVIEGLSESEGEFDTVGLLRVGTSVGTDGLDDMDGVMDGDGDGLDVAVGSGDDTTGALVGSLVGAGVFLVGAGVGDLVGADVIALHFVTPCSPTPAISNPILQPHKY